MSNDLLGRITQTFEKRLKNVNIKATSYEDVNDYAVALGEILTTAFNIHITENPGEIIEQILNDRLKENHRLITDFGRMVQDILNKQAKIGLEAQIPEVNQSRINGLVSRLTQEDFEKSKWLLGSPIVNFSQSVVDDMVRKNAEFHYKSGMSPKIIRKETGKCCKWCKNLVGTYRYPDVPKDVYRRHQNCRCTVEYIPKKGVRQDVHTKKIKYETKEGTKELPYTSVKAEWLKNYRHPMVSDMKYWEHEGVKYLVDGKYVVLDYTEKEKLTAVWLSEKLGVHVKSVPRINYPEKISTPDFLINDMKFDYKGLKGNGKNTVENNTRKTKTQAENIVFDLTETLLTEDEFFRQLTKIYEYGNRGLNVSIIKKRDVLIDILKRKK